MADKSGTYNIPSSVTLTGSIQQVASGGALTPLFSGDVMLSTMGVASYDATVPVSSTNFLTVQVRLRAICH